MKILFVSMHAIHATRWIKNLSDSSHELYWFDVMGNGALDIDTPIVQFANWEKRKFPLIKGEYFFQQKFPNLFKKIQSCLEVTANEALEKIILEIQPDLVHSFEMHSCSYPILKTMQKYPNLKWLYSCWGSDLYKYKEIPFYLPKIEEILKRIDYLHTDCIRDYDLAIQLGFKGKHTGVVPGGGGFKLDLFQSYFLPFEERKIILVKGYQHHVGRGLQIVKALEQLTHLFKQYQIVVFGAHLEVQKYIDKKKLPFKYYDRHGLSHEDILRLMGSAVLYIGNSTSDGMPNTLLEAIIMGAFPIQSNPGGVTAEIIQNMENGMLIENPESVEEIKEIVENITKNPQLIQKAISFNQQELKIQYEYTYIQQKIIDLYFKIEKEL